MIFLIGLSILTIAAVVAAWIASADHGAPGVIRVSITYVVVALLWSIGMSISPVSTGHVGVAKWFGAVQPTAYPEGLRFMNPMYDVKQMSIQRASVDFSQGKEADGPKVVAVSQDRNPVRVEASFPYAVNPTAAWRILQRIGDRDDLERQLIVPAARAAIRDVVAQYAWADASITRRAEVEQRLADEAARATIADLTRLGFSEADARAAVTFMPVLLREILPDDKVLNAIAERVAAEEDLRRQEVMTSIAEKVAERRANEGLGVQRLFGQLPANFTPGQIKEVLLALAEKERADALMKAVENNKVSIMVLPSSAPIAVTAPAAP